MKDLPDNPEQRGIVLPLTAQDLAVCKSDPESRGMLADDTVAVVALPLEAPPSEGSLLARLSATGQLESGTPLVLDPHRPGTYYAFAEASTQIAASKHQLAVELCQLLGAKSVELDEVRGVTRDAVVTVEVKGNRAKVVSGSVRAQQRDVESLVQRLSTHNTFPGGDPDVEAAKTFLLERGLANDTGLQTLISLRSHESNPVVRHQVQVSTKDEGRRTRNLLLKCKIPTAALQAELDTAISEAVSYELTFTASF